MSRALLDRGALSPCSCRFTREPGLFSLSSWERDALRRLGTIGLLTWDASHIAFALTPSDLQVSDLSSLHDMLGRIQNNRRKVLVPLRLVRFIAAPSKRCLIATILGHLICCLSYRVLLELTATIL
jgi:hypothetical protein